MSKLLSVLIPSRNEQFLPNTVADLLKHATQDIEVIPILDGYWPLEPLPDDKRLHTIHFGQSRGMRAAINAGAAIAKGEYLMKVDAHCSFGEGFDEILKADCDKDWVVIPRRDRLDAERWCRQESHKPSVDYEFLSYPFWKPEEPGMHGTIWTERILERLGKPEYDVDENMSFQGSCWFMTKRHFERIGPMDEANYFGFIQEPQEIGLKTWLSGGKIMRNRRTTYLHLHKGRAYGRGYFIDKRGLERGNKFSINFWMQNQPFPGRVHDIEWLVDRFAPVPTWPADKSSWIRTI